MGVGMSALLGSVAALANLASSFESSSGDDGGLFWLLAAGPASAVGTYWAIYRYYRNTDKSHNFERETAIESQPITGADNKVDERNGTTDKSIPGDNRANHRSRVKRVP